MSFLDSYYKETYGRPIRDDLIRAIQFVSGQRIAVDAGCGAGADIAFLLENGFVVHAFDVEQRAIKICQNRFKSNASLFLSRSSFGEFTFPSNSLTVADSSLFFCDPSVFASVWVGICRALNPGGVFCGSFLGEYDGMHDTSSEEKQRWKNTLALSEKQIKALFDDFEILSLTEVRENRKVSKGIEKKWHLYSVVARKL